MRTLCPRRPRAAHVAIAAVTLVIALLGVACSKNGNVGDSIPTAPGGESTDNLAVARFVDGITASDALRFSRDHQVRIVAYEHTIELSGERATAFLPAYPNENESQLVNRWQDAYASFVKSASGVLKQMPLADKPEFNASTASLSRSFAASSPSPPSLSGKFDALIISAPAGKLNELRADMKLEIAEATPQENSRAVEPHAIESTQRACYTPSAGRTITQPSPYYSGQREAYNYFGWSSTCWSSRTTFELDFILNNSCPSSLGCGTYLDAGTGLYGFPRYEYAVTNQPAAYLDSRSGDADYVRAYTLGCADAVQLAAGRTYYTYWRTRNGSASSDNGSINAEYGVRLCDSYNTWCSGHYPSRDIIIPSWQLAVPGTRNW